MLTSTPNTKDMSHISGLKSSLENLDPKTEGLARNIGLSHIAIIMDGNRRWAKAKGKKLAGIGHKAGAQAAEAAIHASRHVGLEHLTLYGFSTENWSRPAEEVNALLALMSDQFERLILTHMDSQDERNTVAFQFIGNRSGFSQRLVKSMERVETLSSKDAKLTVHIALNYGGRADLVEATKHLAREVQAGRLDPDAITEAHISKNLSLNAAPEPDLLIRTSGEQRLSNFLIWELAYTEFLFLDCLWPDFGHDDLVEAIHIYQGRSRRFGGRPHIED